MRRFALGFYIGLGVVVLSLFGSILQRVTYTVPEFLLWFILSGLVLFAILAAWRAGSTHGG